MMFRILSLLTFQVAVQSFSYNWTWFGGSSATQESLIWPPSKGVFVTTESPGSRIVHGMFIDVDANTAYIFGGIAFDLTANVQFETNDLWSFDFEVGSANAWKWIHGSNTPNDPGFYTSIGDTNDLIYPGARHSFASFYDKDIKKYFLFGGMGFADSSSRGYLNDRWSYDVTTNRFTWLGGSTTINLAVNYVLNVESDSTSFGGFEGASSAYDSVAKVLYMFSGLNPSSQVGILWRYRVSNNRLTALYEGLGVQSSIITIGTFHSGNNPGFRIGSSLILVDRTKLYMVGGNGVLPLREEPDRLIGSTSNELWLFDISSNMWAFLSGSTFGLDMGIYSTNSSIAYPASRVLANFIYDQGNNVALLQGGRSMATISFYTELSDQWILNLTSHQWVYLSGDTTSAMPANYGSYRVTGSSNNPGFRSGSAVFSQGNDTYIFGGLAKGDFWKVDLGDVIVSSTTTTTTAITTVTTPHSSTTTVTIVEATSQTSSIETTIQSTTAVLTEQTSTSLAPQSSIEGTSTYSETASTSGLSSTLLYWTTNSSTETIIAESTLVVSRVTSETTSLLATTETIKTIPVGTESPSLTDNGPSESTIRSSTSRTVENLNTMGTEPLSTLTKILSRNVDSKIVRTGNAEEQDRVLDPMIIISASVGFGLLLLFLILMLVVFLFTRRKRNYAAFYNSASALPMRTQFYEVSTNNATMMTSTLTSTPGGTTLFTQAQDVLSIPAYLEVTVQSFRINSKLSQGGGGDIYLADALDDRTSLYGKTIIVKTIKFSSSTKKPTEKQMQLFEQELSIMAMFKNHRNFAKLVGFCRADSYFILMKYYPLGSLENYLQNGNMNVNKSLVTNFISDIASAIQALHQKDMSHSDIKTANVLIDKDEEGFAYCVLTDFGITQVLSLNLVVNGFNVTNIRGLSCAYASPEAFIRQRSQGRLSDKPEVFKAGDIYSMGCILYELLTRKFPW